MAVVVDRHIAGHFELAGAAGQLGSGFDIQRVAGVTGDRGIDGVSCTLNRNSLNILESIIVQFRIHIGIVQHNTGDVFTCGDIIRTLEGIDTSRIADTADHNAFAICKSQVRIDQNAACGCLGGVVNQDERTVFDLEGKTGIIGVGVDVRGFIQRVFLAAVGDRGIIFTLPALDQFVFAGSDIAFDRQVEVAQRCSRDRQSRTEDQVQFLINDQIVHRHIGTRRKSQVIDCQRAADRHIAVERQIRGGREVAGDFDRAVGIGIEGAVVDNIACRKCSVNDRN